jgi:translation initiation factor 1 (eIF-1/SUI1)
MVSVYTMSKDARLVYSSDASGTKAVNWVAKLRIEKVRGKTLTVIDDLPKLELFLKELCAELKKKFGAGGSFDMSGKEGRIDIQGDHRDAIRELFAKKGYKTKG